MAVCFGISDFVDFLVFLSSSDCDNVTYIIIEQ